MVFIMTCGRLMAMHIFTISLSLSPGERLHHHILKITFVCCTLQKGNVALHYAAASGLQKCVELLVAHGAGLFLENRDRLTPCDLAVRAAHHDVATFLESRMVFVSHYL